MMDDDREFQDTFEIEIGEDAAGCTIVWAVRFTAVDSGYGVVDISLDEVATEDEVFEPAPWLARAMLAELVKLVEKTR